MPIITTANKVSLMETILFIAFLVAVALTFALLVVETYKQNKRIRAWEDRLIQVELDTDHLFHEVNALKAEVAQLAKQAETQKKTLANPKLVVIETELALPKFAKPTATEQPTEKKAKPAAKPKQEQQPQAPADKPQTKENKFSAAFAATHRTQYLAYRKQGLSIREAGAKAGVSRTTACRYERWAKRQK